ncbi:MAG: TIGR02449 family protein [Xanthomonadaceae bacterium]|jgi:cell division protein ZapB|nr:TIGR02449 family protein [Xanthomonadaceae bacterium]
MSAPIDPRTELARLDARIEDLSTLVRRLAEENQRLRTAQAQLADERAQLLSRNELARSRVEAMIQRLKSLEARP